MHHLRRCFGPPSSSDDFFRLAVIAEVHTPPQWLLLSCQTDHIGEFSLPARLVEEIIWYCPNFNSLPETGCNCDRVASSRALHDEWSKTQIAIFSCGEVLVYIQVKYCPPLWHFYDDANEIASKLSWPSQSKPSTSFASYLSKLKTIGFCFVACFKGIWRSPRRTVSYHHD